MSSRTPGDSATAKKGANSLKTHESAVFCIKYYGDNFAAYLVLIITFSTVLAVKSIQARKRRAKGKAVKRPPVHDKAKTLEKRSVCSK